MWVVEGVPHHITQRGNNRQDVFLTDQDRTVYLEQLRDKCRQHDVAVLGWCLMTNHVHLVAVPRQPTSLALAPGGQPTGFVAGFVTVDHAVAAKTW